MPPKQTECPAGLQMCNYCGVAIECLLSEKMNINIFEITSESLKVNQETIDRFLAMNTFWQPNDNQSNEHPVLMKHE